MMSLMMYVMTEIRYDVLYVVKFIIIFIHIMLVVTNLYLFIQVLQVTVCILNSYIPANETLVRTFNAEALVIELASQCSFDYPVHTPVIAPFITLLNLVTVIIYLDA